MSLLLLRVSGLTLSRDGFCNELRVHTVRKVITVTLPVRTLGTSRNNILITASNETYVSPNLQLAADSLSSPAPLIRPLSSGDQSQLAAFLFSPLPRGKGLISDLILLDSVADYPFVIHLTFDFESSGQVGHGHLHLQGDPPAALSWRNSRIGKLGG